MNDALNKEALIALLKAEVVPAHGCTEPGAVALAAAHAAAVLGDAAVRKVAVMVNANVYKNGVAVGIPGTGETGLPIAAALGAVKKCPDRQLAVLAEVSEDELQLARSLVARGMVSVEIAAEKKELWIKARVESSAGWGEAVIAERHTKVVSVSRNGEELFAGSDSANRAADLPEDAPAGRRAACPAADPREIFRSPAMSIAGLVKAVEAIPAADLDFLDEGVAMNLNAAQAGITGRLGMGIGALYDRMIADGLLADDMVNYAKKLTAAAADARMSGENIPVMSSAGSGNHGLAATLPVYAAARHSGAPRERLVRAIALSHLIVIYIKMHTGNLSALCGCAVAAASGATAAITWLMGGDIAAIGAAMKNVIANLTGMICDGGKVGCSLKLSTAAAAAVESSFLACRGIVVPDTNGIIAAKIEDTIRNLGMISDPGMLYTDKVIMDVILAKQKLPA